MDRRGFLLGTMGAIGTATIGSLAFTSATASRSAEVQVKMDSSSDTALRLESGPAGGTELNGSQLLITGEQGGKHTTPDGSFTFGDPDNPTSVYSFRMTNNLAETREFALTGDTDPDSADMGVEMFDSTGTKIGSSASTINTVTADNIVMEATASLPANTGITVTVYENTNPGSDSSADNSQVVLLSEGTNTYEVNNIDFDSGNNIWFEAEFIGDPNNPDQDPSLSGITLLNEGGNPIEIVDSSAGQIVSLNAGEVGYGLISIDTSNSPSTDITGTLTISTSASENFS